MTAVTLNSFLLSPAQTKPHPRWAKIPTHACIIWRMCLFCFVCFFQALEIYILLMLVSEQPSSCWQGLGTLLQTHALCTDLPPLQFLLNNQSLQITGPPLTCEHPLQREENSIRHTDCISPLIFPILLKCQATSSASHQHPASFVSLSTPQRLRRRSRTVRRTHHSLTHRCSLTGVRTSAQTSDGWRWRCSSTTAIMATSAIACL